MTHVHRVLAANKLWSVKYIIGGLLYFQLIPSVTLDTYSCSVLGPASQTQFILQFIIFLVSAAERKATLSSHNHINILQKTNDISEGGGNVFQAQIEQNARGFSGSDQIISRIVSVNEHFLKNSIKVLSDISERRRWQQHIWKISPQGKVGEGGEVMSEYLCSCHVFISV